jgi:hypothetical protein
MNTNRNKLVLRRQSIRTLTAGELSFAHGGQGNGTGGTITSGTGTTINTGTCIPTRPATQTKPTTKI